ncbi:MAG TPA: patatin-like phospholipase family protein [Trueperaceae bacterium]
MRQRQREKRVGLVLSGGGARGFAHIGVLRVLEEAGIEVDVVAGTSMGAILGALYAHGYKADDLHLLASSLKWRDIVDLSLQGGLMKGEKLANWLSAYLPDRFEELARPLAVTTTDVETGEEVTLMKGDLIAAVRASSCFPGAFEPVQIGGRTLADGGIINNLPVDAAAFLGATATIASDATPPRRSSYDEGQNDGNWWERMVANVRLERRSPMLQMLLRSSDIMQSILTDIQYTMHPADLLVKLDMPEIRVESFREYDRIVALGEEAARRAFTAAGLIETSGNADLATSGRERLQL